MHHPPTVAIQRKTAHAAVSRLAACPIARYGRRLQLSMIDNSPVAHAWTLGLRRSTDWPMIGAQISDTGPLALLEHALSISGNSSSHA